MKIPLQLVDQEVQIELQNLLSSSSAGFLVLRGKGEKQTIGSIKRTHIDEK